jgi:hypothetical protein
VAKSFHGATGPLNKKSISRRWCCGSGLKVNHSHQEIHISSLPYHSCYGSSRLAGKHRIATQFKLTMTFHIILPISQISTCQTESTSSLTATSVEENVSVSCLRYQKLELVILSERGVGGVPLNTTPTSFTAQAVIGQTPPSWSKPEPCPPGQPSHPP